MAAATAELSRPDVGPGQRLGATLVLSVLAHALLILGIGFAAEDPAPVLPTLDVILTEARSERAPQRADFLAQANNEGGGTLDRAERPSALQTSDVPVPEPGVAPRPLPAQAPLPQPVVEDRPRIVTGASRAQVAPPPRRVPEETVPRPLAQGPTLLERELEIAQMNAQLEQRRQAYARRPRRHWVTASTQEYAYASYMRGWVDKVEQVGNLNYPERARQQGIGGQVVLTVAVRRDGSVEAVSVVHSSGQPVLDQAAMRTVELSQPFPPLPQTQDGIDVLHITRTWNYRDGSLDTEYVGQ